MKLSEIETPKSNVIVEGGNVFKTKEGEILTQRINRADVLPTVKWVEKITGLPLVDNMLGTTGKNPTSGDLDLAVDETKASKDEIVAKLVAWCRSQNLEPKEYVKKTGVSVHLKTPINGNPANGFVQTDLMLGDPKWMKFSMQGGAQDSQFKGMHKHVLLASIAKAQGMKWSFSQGLIDRATNEVITRDGDEIAEKLLGPGTTRNDLATVETVLRKIKGRHDYDALVADAVETFGKEGKVLPECVTSQSPGWFKQLVETVDGDANLLEGARIAHAEDLVFYEGSAGALRALNNIANLNKSRHTLSIKWDGKPALIFGRDEEGTFIMTDKSGFTAKGYNGRVTSPSDLKKMIMGRKISGDPAGRQEYANTLARLWPMVEKTVPAGFQGYILGDLMYFTTPNLNKDGYYEFTPNTVTYEVDKASDLGKQIGKSKAGIAVHTYFSSPDASGYPLLTTAGLNTNGPVMVLGPDIKQDAPLQIDKTDITQIRNYVKQTAASVDKLLNASALAAGKMTGLPDIFYAFVNAMTKTQSLSNLAEKFLPWVDANPKISEPMKAKIAEYIEANKAGFVAMFSIFDVITTLKVNTIRQLDAHDGPVRSHIAGVRGHEGYVNTDPAGNIKMVNRLGFSASNFAGNTK